jgi:cephalosporin-C deacetylase-like acetyl esterase
LLGFSAFLDGYHDVENQLIDYLRSKAERAIAAKDVEKQRIRTREDFEKYRKEVLDHFLEVIGGLPGPRTDLKAETTGVIEGDGYRIEKVIFQSLPGFYVTCNLYLPEIPASTGPVPGILFAPGHSKVAKAAPAYQKVCLDLVNNGFAVLAVDPIGQGERFQYWRNGHEDVESTIVEHTYAGIKCSLLGMSLARYFCWDLIRALDYLCARPEVDENRIGMTGTSGGGTQTSYMMLLDQRIKAAVPCTYITSRRAYLATGQAHDMEQNLFEAIVHSPDHDDFLACFSPRPVLVGAVESDFFNVEGTVESVETARRIYELYGAADKLQLKIAPGTHAFVPELREAAVNWFRVHLTGLEPSFRTDDPFVRATHELNCTRSGQIVGDYPDAVTIHDLMVAELEKRKQKWAFNPRLLERTLAHPKPEGPKYPRIIQKDEVEDGIIREKVFFWSEKGIIVSGLLAYSADNSKEPVLLLLEHGTSQVEEAWETIIALVAEGRWVFLFDPRGVGAVATRSITPHGITTWGTEAFHFFETDYRLQCDAQMLGTSIIGMQVADVLRGIEYLIERSHKERVVLAGRGRGALLAALAGALAPVSQLRLSPLPPSFERIIRKRLYRPERVPIMLGPLNSWDLPDIYHYLKRQGVEVYQHITEPLGYRL